jgi:hypothetical protein
MEKAKERDRSVWGAEPTDAVDSGDERNDDELVQDDSVANPAADPALESFGTNELAQAAEAQWNAAFRSPNRPSLLHGHRSFMSGSNDMLFRSTNQTPGRKALRTRYDDGEAPEGPIELTDLQRLISEGIVQKGLYAHIDDIYAHVAKVPFPFRDMFVDVVRKCTPTQRGRFSYSSQILTFAVST